MQNDTHNPRPESREAFTLLEMVVVLAILVVLTGVAGTVFFGQRAETEKDRARADLQIIQQGLEAYRARFGSYPKLPDDYSNYDDISEPEEYLLNALCGQIGPEHDDLSEASIPPMVNYSLLTFRAKDLPLTEIKKNSIIDPWDNAYEYEYSPDEESWVIFGYTLRSYGPNGIREDLGDDILAE